MKRILATTDLSQDSEKALPTAAKTAKLLGAEVVLLAVVEDVTKSALAFSMDYPIHPDPSLQKQIIEKLKKDLEVLKAKHFAEVSCKTLVVETLGGVSEEIIAVADKEKVDLILMGSHGRSSLSKLLLGSVTERVLHYAKCPVMVVPRAAV